MSAPHKVLHIVSTGTHFNDFSAGSFLHYDSVSGVTKMNGADLVNILCAAHDGAYQIEQLHTVELNALAAAELNRLLSDLHQGVPSRELVHSFRVLWFTITQEVI